LNPKRLRETIQGALSELELTVLGDWSSKAKTAALEVGHYYGLSTVALLQSLPDGIPLDTVDHHMGDKWAPRSLISMFEKNVIPHVGSRTFQSFSMDFTDASDYLQGPYGFVFYDAAHDVDSCEMFWSLYRGAMSQDCILVFDDADWESMDALRQAALGDDFDTVPVMPRSRKKDDKADPETYTLEVMRRS
jgi:predicted O-methyltransferase YrrM